MKKILFSLGIFGIFVLGTGKVFACSCVFLPEGKKAVATAYKNSTVVFYGKVISISKNTENYYVTVKFKVEKSWKNQSKDELTIQTGQGGGDCGFPFEAGREYLVYAYGNNTVLETNICQRTSYSDADSTYLNKIKKPRIFAKESKRENQ
jgi:hypothetical protein